ncbi:hypothetical protein [Glycomyces xiaoerkulensis]|uniref:hypothetical protein n=1 Tax=Glycomyces xiaoerkulensis TaxID=2038139 RepID=UPI000C262D42|nr:hypothetical protein [Glycomyces xiaoerkulensis]
MTRRPEETPETDSGSTGGSGGGDSGVGSDPDAEAAAEEVEQAAFEPVEPRMPWYVWALVPAGMVGAYLMYQVMGGTRAAAPGNGAIDRIRSHNLHRNAGVLEQADTAFVMQKGRITAAGSGAQTLEDEAVRAAYFGS